MPDTKKDIAELRTSGVTALRDFIQGRYHKRPLYSTAQRLYDEIAAPLLDQLEQREREVQRWKAAADANTEEAAEWETKWLADHEASEARVAELTAEVEELKLERDTALTDRHDEMLDTRRERDEAEALVARLRGALEPFAKLTVNGALPAEFAAQYPKFAEAVEAARQALQEGE